MRTRFVRGATLRQAEQDATAFTDGEEKKKKPKNQTGQIRYALDFDNPNALCACGGVIGVIGYATPGGDRMCYACASVISKDHKK